MIDSINIKNFQSHKNTELALVSGVNVIVGPSDSGKTAIIRALKWLIYNRPLGGAFRSNWGGEKTEVGIKIKTETLIRQVGSGGNIYKLGPTRFAAVGTEVPQEIQKALNFEEVNLQLQLDQPFLLSQSPGEVARYFNKIAHIDQIDAGLKKVESALTKIKQEIKADEVTVVRLEEEIQQYDYLEKVEVEIEVIEGMQTNLDQLKSTQNKISKWIDDYLLLEKEMEEIEEEIVDEEAINLVLGLYDDKERVKKEEKELSVLIGSISTVVNEIEELSELSVLEETVVLIIDLMDQQTEINEKIIKLEGLISSLKDTEKRIKEGELYLKQTEIQFHKEMPDVCPLCDQRVKK
jgi:exonuclease SbcC